MGIVRSFLAKSYEENKLDKLSFNEINNAVRVSFPNSKFNPYHLAHYKHKFISQLGDIKMYKGRVR